MSYVIVLFLLLAVVWVISAPLRRGSSETRAERDTHETESMRRIDLRAARDAKYREIRDAELDHQTGKLSDDDFAAIDSGLRADAVELLHELDALDEAEDAEREG